MLFYFILKRGKAAIIWCVKKTQKPCTQKALRDFYLTVSVHVAYKKHQSEECYL